MKADGIKKVLCVLGGGSTEATGLWDRITKSLKENGIEYSDSRRVAVCKDPANKIEAVLAIGGGSVIDTAKGIASGRNSPAIFGTFTSESCPPEEPLPMYTVLTLSATGSEYNNCSVMSSPEEERKIRVFFANRPRAGHRPNRPVHASVASGDVRSCGCDVSSYGTVFSRPNRN
ncbi:putative NADH-dependent alcohol dehydrogenase [Blattamonas nauphoetae]|uniref:NADH-dependent alcohol dehydrogenase n=1 Tax=Blattamonas nauphoetae TaxID=2049346 RepID=A0ABQ9WP61_9EUKA|nr:putative NADH-dependent alcohol dehydrogenase [Blattamonas nauphoetae]